jgi:hypothetical protein
MKLDELQRLLEANHAPVWVKAVLYRLGQLTFKLLHCVHEVKAAFGTPKVLAGPHASDFPGELMQAYVAFDWPRVGVLVHGVPSQTGG